MSDVALRMSHVHKKFKRGESHDSLRDLVPALARSLFRRVANPMALKREEFWALRDISFEVKQGEAVGIIGHNGAGKSTILKHLSGLMKPTSGLIEVRGRLSALIEVGAGFHADLTGRENVYLNGTILGMSRAEVRQRFDEIVEFSGLRDFIDTPVKRYSSGMYARLGFSVAVHMRPDILIIDEVLSVGDYVFQTKSIEKMRSVLRSGTTVIFVSHNLHAVVEMCPRSLLLRNGQLIQDGPTTEIVRAYMDEITRGRREFGNRDVIIESVTVRDRNGPRLDFEAGERAWVDVKATAARRVEKVACVIMLRDGSHHEIFNTSSERLGMDPVTLEEGESVTFTFRLDLHLANGSFGLAIVLYRYDIEHIYDQLDPVATLVITSRKDVRGAVNLYPELSVEPVTPAQRSLPARAAGA